MPDKNFYLSPSYRAKQSQLTKVHWETGHFDFLRKETLRYCVRHGCPNAFTTIPSDPKKYCSNSCAASVNNRGRTQRSVTKKKISRSLTGRKYPNRFKSPSQYRTCFYCKKEFLLRYWRPVNNPVKYCSRMCAIKNIGERPTSPKAARAKAGIRKDINPHIYFFSRWEANYARLLDHLKIKWVHQPKTFQLITQKYTPDFYLPDQDTYIEIKNYLSPYSKNRDDEFRKVYPDIKLTLILKSD